MMDNESFWERQTHDWIQGAAFARQNATFFWEIAEVLKPLDKKQAEHYAASAAAFDETVIVCEARAVECDLRRRGRFGS
jgi:hypothetical protein